MRPLLAIKSVYTLVYAVDGAIFPFLAVFLAQQHGLEADQIGIVLAVSGGAAIISPPLVTMLADRYGNARRLLFVALLLSGAALLGFALIRGYWWLLLLFAAYGLCREPTRPLLDGIFFVGKRTTPDLAEARFHRVRIWGSVGFMVPGVVLYFAVGSQGDSLASLPYIACTLALLTLVFVRQLPAAAPKAEVAGQAAGQALGHTARAACRVLLRPNVAVFVLGMFLLQAAMATYMAFYPLQATEVGVPTRWLGPLSTLGVAVELVYMAAFGWFVRVLGWRWFMVVGALVAAARMVLLAAVPGIATLVGTQLVHGLVIVVMMIGARSFLDRMASDDVRYSVQGLYVMLVMGGGRIFGNAFGGELASSGLGLMFWAGAVASLVAAGLLWWALRFEKREAPG